MYKILVVDDESRIRSIIKKYAEFEGHTIVEAGDGMEAVYLCRQNEFDMVIMDIMMPELDGISAMLKIREISNIPVILLTAKGEDSDKILGLNIGADDYITKPFNPVEVIARIRSQLRRFYKLGAGETASSDKTIKIGSVVLDDMAKQVFVDGDEVNLTPTEYEILKLLMKNKGAVLSPKEIYESVWKDEPIGAESTVAVHIRHLREKIEINPAEPRYLKVVWAHGYKFEKDVK